MSIVYNSIVYAKLCDEDTGLYRESGVCEVKPNLLISVIII